MESKITCLPIWETGYFFMDGKVALESIVVFLESI